MIPDLYVYRARISKPDGVIDGDTVDAAIDCGLWIVTKRRLRLCQSTGEGMNAPEPRGPERDAGLAATEYLRFLLDEHASPDWRLYVRTIRDRSGKFGRLLADLFVESPTGRISLCDRMIAAGHARAKSYRSHSRTLHVISCATSRLRSVVLL